MSGNPDDDLSIDPSQWGPEPWEQREPLEALLDRGLTIQEIIDVFHTEGYDDCPSYDAMRRRIGSHGLTTAHHRPKYTDDWAPLYATDRAEFPLPSPIVDAYDISEGTTLQFRVVSRDGQLKFIAEPLDRSPKFANETRAKDAHGLLPHARVPTDIARRSGLLGLGGDDEPNGVRTATEGTADGPTVEFDMISDRAFSVSPEPALLPWSPTSGRDVHRDVSALDPVRKSLQPLFYEDADHSPDSVRSYRLTFPTAYCDAYSLTDGGLLEVYYGVNSPTDSLSIVIRPRPGDEPDQNTIRVSGYEAGRYEGGEREVKTTVLTAYIPKAMLQSLGAGLSTARPNIQLVPHPTHIELRI